MKSYSLVLLVYEEEPVGEDFDITDILEERLLFRGSSLPDVKGLFTATVELIEKAMKRVTS